MTLPRTAPRPARRAAVAAFVVLAATVPLTAGAAGAAGTQAVDAALPYVCALPSGEQPATVRISATLPDRAVAGEPVRPADVTTTVELPEQAVTDLTALGAAGVRAATRLAVGVAQGEAAAEAVWRGDTEPVPLPPSGPLTLAATGDVPTVTGRGTHDLTFTAGSLTVDLAPSTADGGATDPASLTVPCRLADEAPDGGRLATVPLGTDGSGGTESPSGSPSGEPSASGTPGQPGGGDPERQGERAPKVAEPLPGGGTAERAAPTCKYDAKYPAGPMSLNAYITGYANVNKLDGAALIPPFCTLITQGEPQFEFLPDFSGATITQHSTADLWYQQRKRTPPFQATFLSFDFTPTKATMVLEQTGPMTIDSNGFTDFAFTSTDTYVRAPITLRVTALEVNGTPLDVGTECRTRTSLASPEPEPEKYPGDHLILHGRGEQNIGEPATGYLLLSGGPLTGEVTIPAFTGCGTADGENLDRLLTASVSGPGNYVKQIQGQACFVSAEVLNPDECTEDAQPKKIPVAER
ncbi:DUF6801 domain-containing protein [Streptomyces griseoviridis]|uniref:DUF6801 domain-containing protein n=1 Tax=Streptomyces griseoviridis TaxID=45398 RepID=A0A918GKG6_STRGD|nr:DUF6801 domain-containing protein [Streptomyces niveoruber]GGS41881.1 hypothetical protein GCM10010238_34370 [Streptomyces niveoruber]